jgi:alpha-1,3-glucosyltransferase
MRQNRSEWTLDYPPFFAAFEWLLSQFAQLVDPAMLKIENLGYDSWATVAFQRTTVVLTELVLAGALYLYAISLAGRYNEEADNLFSYIRTTPVGSQRSAHAAALSVLLSPGLFIIDHIHFQYNGFLYGVLILSLVLARKQATMLWSGVLFATLLMLKHIYLYLAPAYFVFLLRAYCLSPRSIFRIRFINCVKLGLGLILVFGAALGPFVSWGQGEQLLSRLFPFSRGLCHAYWAPNVWALYSFVDRILIYGMYTRESISRLT